MPSIYILSGRVFGKNIYEIDCVEDINQRVLSESTGFPNYNIVHYSIYIKEQDIKKCKQKIYEDLHDYCLPNSNFFKLDLNLAKHKINNIIINLKDIDDSDKENKPSKYLCFL